MVLTRQQLTRINVSPGLTSSLFQETILQRLQELRLRSAVSLVPQSSGSVPNQKLMFFIDDLNTGPLVSGTQPCMETLREMISHKITYDRRRNISVDSKNIVFLAACTTPGSPGTGFGVSCHSLTDRLVRQFAVFNFFTPTDEALQTLYGGTLQAWLEEFPSYAVEYHFEFAKAMSRGILDLYHLMSEKFRPTLDHAHYVFTLHDVAHVVEGLLLLSSRKTKAKPKRGKGRRDTTESMAALYGTAPPGGKVHKDKFKALSVKESKDVKQHGNSALPMMPIIARLWCHEVSRVFADRLLYDDDEVWFQKTLHKLTEKHFCTASPEWLESMGPSKPMRMITEEIPVEVKKKDAEGGRKGTPIPYDRSTSENYDDSDSSDGSMTEVTMEVVTPFSEPDQEAENHDSDDVRDSKERDDEETDFEAMTPFTETTVNLPDLPLTPEQEDERPTFDNYGSSEIPDNIQSSSRSSSETNGHVTITEMAIAEPIMSTSGVTSALESIVPVSSQAFSEGGIAQEHAPQFQLGGTGAIKKKASLRRTDSRRRTVTGVTVTFKMGLIADKEVRQEYKGALMSMDEICGTAGELSGILFTKYFVSAYADFVGANSERGYAQYSEPQVTEALDACLHIFNSATGVKLNLVFFKEAVHHACRLARILALPGAHALLLGLPHGAGRTTLMRLAAHVSHSKVFEVKRLSCPLDTWQRFKEQAKLCSYTAGVSSRPTVLYVHSEMPEQVLMDLCCLMSEGKCPGLYSDQEMQHIASAITPGQVQMKRIDKIEIAFERFLKKVRQNMHIVISLDYKAHKCEETFELFRRFPQLITRSSYVDCFKPWMSETYECTARKWLMNPMNSDKVLWDRDLRSEQVVAVSKAMAYIQKTSESAVERLHCHRQTSYRFFTPLTFQEFFTVFLTFFHKILQTAQEKAAVLKIVLDKVDEAFMNIRNLEDQAAMLEPKVASAEGVVADLRQRVEEWRQKYIQALDECKKCEDKLEGLQKPLMELREQADAEFDKVNPTYYAAMEAIKMLNPQALEELKSYRVPPQNIHIVGEALCIMFGQQHNDWETAKQLMFKKNFYQDLEFYDKNHVPDHVYKELRKYCAMTEFDPETIQGGSKAAAAICAWIHAVFRYASIYRKIAPKIADLLSAEDELNKAQAELGQKRILAMKTKTELEKLIQEHHNASITARNIEKQHKIMKTRIAEAKDVMAHMELQTGIWRSDLAESEVHVLCALGDAVLVAACCCYLGPFDAHTREMLLNDWREQCYFSEFDFNVSCSGRLERILTTGRLQDIPSTQVKLRQNLKGTPAHTGAAHADAARVPRKHLFTAKRPLLIRDDFSLERILSSFEEVSVWRLGGLGLDIHGLHSILIMRASAEHNRFVWPFLIDPDSQAESLVRMIHRRAGTIDSLANGSTANVGVSVENRDSFHESVSGNQSEDPIVFESEGVATELNALDAAYPLKLSTSQTPSISVDDLGPVQSYKLRTESLISLCKADAVIDRPADNLWVVSASDTAEATKCIINALVHGVTVLVKNVDRCQLDPELNPVLLKQFKTNNGGQKTVVVGGFTYHVHPKFVLYLSTSTPLYLRGDDSVPLPIGHSNVIDLSISQQGRIDMLLTDLTRLERPEYEAQARSIDAGILQHQQQLNSDHEGIQSKILSLASTILDDKTMLTSLRVCRQNIARNNQVLEETAYLKNQMELKRESYLLVALHAALIFDVMEHMSVLSPYYFLPFERYQHLCQQTVAGRNRGKGATGAPKARSQELTNAITEAAFSLMSTMLFERDTETFTVLLALQRLVSSQQATNQEVLIFVNGVPNVKLSAEKHKVGPIWMEHEDWLACCKLEEVLVCFSGLTEVILSHCKEWREYMSSRISLMSSIPGDKLKLTIFQKCILWRIMKPDKLSEVCHNFVLTELGPSFCYCPATANPQQYKEVKQSTPVLIVEPKAPLLEPFMSQTDSTTGFPGSSSVDLVEGILSVSSNYQRMSILNFGTGTTMVDVERMLQHCIKSGQWLVLQNCHLAPTWTPTVLHLFEKILALKEVSYAVDETKTRTKPSIPYYALNPGVHPNFKLWLTTEQGQDGRLLPTCLIWNTFKIVNEQRKSYRELVKPLYELALRDSQHMRLANVKAKALTPRYLLAVSLLHGQLVHRSYYQGAAFAALQQWNSVDLHSILSALPKLLASCNGAHSVGQFMKILYSGRCTDPNDAAVVDSLVHISIGSQDSLPVVRIGSKSLLSLIQPQACEQVSLSDFKKQLDGIPVVNAALVGLPESADVSLCNSTSGVIAKCLMRVSGSPELIMKSESRSAFERVDAMLSGWESFLHGLPEFPKTSGDTLSPMELFLHKEVVLYKSLVQTVLRDSELLRGITRGEYSCSPQAKSMIMDIHSGLVPARWRRLLTYSARTLMQWKSDLEKAMTLLSGVCELYPKSILYNLSVFQNSKLFLNSLLVSHARSLYMDVNDLELHAEFLAMGFNPSDAPTSGIFVTGLRLSNGFWDTASATIKTESQDRMVAVPVVHVQPRLKAHSECTQHVFQCPVILVETLGNTSAGEAVFHVSVKVASPLMVRELIARRVCLVSQLRYDHAG